MRKGFTRKFGELIGGTMVSRVLGFLREVVVAWLFGASRATDVFAIALTVPTLFRRILGEDMVEKGFLPPFRSLIRAKDPERAWALASRVFLLLALALAALTCLLYLIAPQVVGVIAPGLKGEDFTHAVNMTYVILPFMALIGMASFAGGLLLFLDRTDVYSLAPATLSLGVIAGVVILKPYIGIYSIAAGFVFGAFLQFAVQLPFVFKEGGELSQRPRLHLMKGESLPEMKTVYSQSGWIFLQSIATKTVEVVDRILASFLVPGSVAALYFSQRLVQLPFAVVGLAVGRAGVTQLNDYAQEERWADFKETLVGGLGYTLGVMIPLAAATFALATPVTQVVFSRGEFGAQSVGLTSIALAMYGVGLPGMGLVALYSRVFPALGRNDLAVTSSLLAAALNVGLNFWLVRTPLRHGGLALSSSIAFTFNALLMAHLLNRVVTKMGGEPTGLGETLGLTVKPLFAGASGGVCAWYVASLVPPAGSFAGLKVGGLGALVLGGLAGGFVFFLCLFAVGLFKPAGEGRRIILTGGGTAGHVNPTLAIGRALEDGNTSFLYVGAKGRVEEVVVPKAGIPLRLVRASGYPGLRPSFALARFLFDLAAGTLKSLLIIARFKPNIIVSTGGYGSAPVLFAAKVLKTLMICRARMVLYEPNAVPGRLTLLVARWADLVLVSFPQSLAYFPENGRVVGYPVRKDIGTLSREEAKSRLGFHVPEGRRVVFAFGGSQGSRTINRALVDALGHLTDLKDEIFIIHGVGLFDTPDYHAKKDTEERLKARYTPDELEEIKGFYLYRDYFHNIEAVYGVADLCIIRGGAGSINEVAKAGIASIIIPKAGLSGDHQVMNARAMAMAGLAQVIYEEPVMKEGRALEVVRGEELAGAVRILISDEERLSEMGKSSREAMGRDPVKNIVGAIAGEEPSIAAEEGPGVESPALPGSPELLTLLGSARAEAGRDYDPSRVIPDPEDLDYLRKRSAGLLISPAWPVRNIGVKLTGLLWNLEKLPVLAHMITERKPVAWYKRLLGGDYEQVGFIRRNCLTAFGVMDRLSPEVEAAILTAFTDPYFEVRAEAARAAAHFGERIGRRDEFQDALLGLLHDRHFEVAEAVAGALGKMGRGAEVLDALLGLGEHRHWRMREAGLRGLMELVERGEIEPTGELKERIRMFLLTATDFRPHFSIKKTFSRLMDAMDEKEGGE